MNHLKQNISYNMEKIDGAGCVEIKCMEFDWFKLPPPPIHAHLGFKSDIGIILAADCVWVENLIVPFIRVLDVCTEKCSTEVLISYQRRGKSAHDAFFKGLQSIFKNVSTLDITSLFSEPIPDPEIFYILACSKH